MIKKTKVMTKHVLFMVCASLIGQSAWSCPSGMTNIILTTQFGDCSNDELKHVHRILEDGLAKQSQQADANFDEFVAVRPGAVAAIGAIKSTMSMVEQEWNLRRYHLKK